MTKVETISVELEQRITTGEWVAGGGLPSRGELALEYAVSPATITSAIRRLQKKGLVRVMQGRGAFVVDLKRNGAAIFPNMLIGLTGSYLPSGKKLSPQGMQQLFASSIFDGIWQEANERHCPVVLLPQLAMNSGVTRDYCRQLGVQGVIFLGGGYANARLLKEEGFPVILANKPAEPTTLNYMDYDNFHMVREMARIFLKAGHRRIGVFHGERGTVPEYYREMRLQMLDELMRHGIVYDLNPYWKGVVRQSGREAVFRGVEKGVSEMLDLPEPPTALFCWEPGMVSPLLKALEKRKRRIPEDVSVIVSSYADELEMEFSGFVMPHRELGAGLLRHLCLTVENPHHGIQELLKPRYVEHGTVGC